ncbi:MAG: 30S ribosomal protein S3 [Armatimonadetes bacterium]|nr:MAG: 30S ribosomal protein S3 [Armatimonadota bacterium]
MGQKINPIGFRIGVIREPDSRWYADKKTYKKHLYVDYRIREFIRKELGKGLVSKVDIMRAMNNVRVTIFAARPGAVIGRQGQGIAQLSKNLQDMVRGLDPDAVVHVDVKESPQPELDAQLIADNIALQLERRISHRRAMRQAIGRHLRNNGRGMKVVCSGRLGGAEIARSESEKVGKIPLHTLRADIDYGLAEAYTTYGVVGVKVWVYRGEVLRERVRQTPQQQGFELEGGSVIESAPSDEPTLTEEPKNTEESTHVDA